LQIAPGAARVVGRAPSGRLGVDGSRLIALDDRLLSARKRMTFNGAALVTVVLDKKGRLLADPQVSTQGLLDEQADETAKTAAAVAAQLAVEKLSRDDREDDGLVEDAVRLAVQRSLKAARGKRPLTQVHVVRV
jgi:ribonuclease J